MEQNYHYYAFISYSHKDETWAEWIHSALEHYRLPAIMRKAEKNNYPRKIAPVFLDSTDLGAGNLAKTLPEELSKSRYLIVLCSPNSACPNEQGKNYIDQEIGWFIGEDRDDKTPPRDDYVIPVIIKGTPQEAFCKSLKEREIKAVDATKHSKARVLNDIVAKLLGLAPDELWKRAERERKRKIVRNAILGGVASLFAALCAFFVYDATRTVVARYADTVDSYGLPEGIFPLGEDEVLGRFCHYRFEYQGLSLGESIHADSAPCTIFSVFGFRRILRRVVRANSAGFPLISGIADIPELSEIQDFEYKSRGLNFSFRLKEKRCGTFNGIGAGPILKRRITYDNQDGEVNSVARFYDTKEGPLDVSYLAANSTSLRKEEISASSHADICQYLITRNKAGRETRRLFLSKGDEHVPDGDGLYGKNFILDNLGRVIEEQYLFLDGERFGCRANKKGVAGKRTVYSGQYQLRTEYVDVSGKPILGPYGYLIMETSQSDKFGNPIVQRYLDATRNPCLTTDGYAEIRNTFDGNGNLVQQEYLGVNGQKVFCKSGFHATRLAYDATGRLVSYEALGTNGARVYEKNGVSIQKRKFDKYARLVSMSNLDVDAKPTLNNAGWHEMKRRYDDEGRMIEEAYYNVDGRLTLAKGGTAGYRIGYDKRGRVSRMTNIGVDGKIAPNMAGLADVRYWHTKQGNIGKCRYYDVNGMPSYNEDGYYGWEQIFDSRGNVIEESFLGHDGMPAMSKFGYATRTIEYDTRGNPQVFVVLDANRKPVMLPSGYCERRCEYNDMGRKERELLLDISGNRAITANGICETCWEYNERGLVRKESYYGAGTMPVADESGVFAYVYEYDDNGHQKRKVTLDGDNRPTASKGAYVAEQRYEYDERGLLRSWQCYDVDGNPCEQQVQAFEFRYEYDALGREIIRYALNHKGEKVCALGTGVHKEKKEWDNMGNLIRWTEIGVDEKPINSIALGYAESRYEYDVFGHRTKELWFLANMTPHSRYNDKVCGFAYKYDTHGNCVRRINLDELGNIVCNTNGIAIEIAQYDRMGHVREIAYLDDKNNKVKCVDGYAALVRECNVSGKITKEVYLDELNRPMRNANGTYATVLDYDSYNRKIRESYLGVDGKTIACNNGFASIIYGYDSRGNMVLTEWFDLKGNLAKMPEGNYSRVVKEYDERGNMTYTAFFGSDCKPFLYEGRASERYEYDNMGRRSNQKWFDKTGKEIPMCSFPIVEYVHPRTPAETLGILRGDVICGLGDYSIRQKPDDFDLLIQMLKVTQNQEKLLVVARKDGAIYKILRLKLPHGSIGCQIVDLFTFKTEYDAIVKALEQDGEK